MLEPWNFLINRCVDKDNWINFVNYKFTFQRLGKKYKRHECKKMALFDVFNRVLALQMKVCHFGMSK
jgi:hypothetical protein